MNTSPSSMYRATDSTVLACSDSGFVPHCRVRPCATSHSTLLSSMASIAGMSSGPPSLIVIRVICMAPIMPGARPRLPGKSGA